MVTESVRISQLNGQVVGPRMTVVRVNIRMIVINRSVIEQIERLYTQGAAKLELLVEGYV